MAEGIDGIIKSEFSTNFAVFLKVACKVNIFQSHNQDGEKSKVYFFLAEIAADGK